MMVNTLLLNDAGITNVTYMAIYIDVRNMGNIRQYCNVIAV